MWVAEVDIEISICAELSMLGHLSALIPGQRPAELFGQCRDRGSDSVAYGLGTVAGQSGPVMDPFPFAVAGHGWEVQQHREPGGSFHKRPDRGAAQPEDVGHLPSVPALPGRRPRVGVR